MGTGKLSVMRLDQSCIRGAAVGLVLALTACAHTPEPGEEVADCGPQYQLRAKQISLPNARPGVASVDIVTSDRYENIPNIQIGFGSSTGRFYVDQLPRSYGYTNSRGQLRVEWHPPETGSSGQPIVLDFDALDFPGNCSVEIKVEP